VEGDFSWTAMGDNREVLASEMPGMLERGQREAWTNYKFDWMATLRGRVGYAFNRWLVYGTGGLAFLREAEERTQFVSSSLTSNDIAFRERDAHTRTGWTLGTGLEFAIDRHWSIKTEYLYSRFGSEEFTFADARSGASDGFSVTTRCSTCTPTRVTTTYPDTYSTVNGRRAVNSAELHSLRVGVNFKF
ncbi:MAG: outer membrane beta-barrel protein, partial [Sphingobium sp.]